LGSGLNIVVPPSNKKIIALASTKAEPIIAPLMTAKQPLLIIVTGRPAAGKSTIAQWLAGELQLPWVSKDSVREVLFEQLGWQDRPWAQKLGLASLELMFYFAQAQFQIGGSLILDNAFDPIPSTPRFQSPPTTI